ncbi:hypothetical protein SYNTR_1928 [Candidatus Syntrophocurvum alkaliphilum]|uniref:Cell division protein DivIC (FtsB), stabilizes FtsL against RasP cleavage n=1 Tax=Candidatus Syntrophocurvum alkaliphilum TaxID=2293317 RepID=A0A6I6DDB8_9FIRM|nr:septum formation initiator family protein [Candidatus Syntrophocurvum alkaliphilum]QGU00522.1 hypothetical protein SYNTR_1928 [Candidatus Syntrophocurvum alkaliphilum]
MKSNFVKKIIIGVICVVLLVTIVPRAKNIWELSLRKAELEKEKAQLLERQEYLDEKLCQLDSPEVIEKIAREQLGLVRQGESFLMTTKTGNKITD